MVISVNLFSKPVERELWASRQRARWPTPQQQWCWQCSPWLCSTLSASDVSQRTSTALLRTKVRHENISLLESSLSLLDETINTPREVRAKIQLPDVFERLRNNNGNETFEEDEKSYSEDKSKIPEYLSKFGAFTPRRDHPDTKRSPSQDLLHWRPLPGCPCTSAQTERQQNIRRGNQQSTG